MPETDELIEKLKDPRSIHYATYASDPATLLHFFRQDSIVRCLADGGPEVAAAIAGQIAAHGRSLDEITLACYTYILGEIDPALAAETVKPLYGDAVRNPDPFFLHFAALALRRSTGLRFDPDRPDFTRAELAETLARISQ